MISKVTSLRSSVNGGGKKETRILAQQMLGSVNEKFKNVIYIYAAIYIYICYIYMLYIYDTDTVSY